MRGIIVKYRKYKSSGQSLISLPTTITDLIDWKDNEEVHIRYKTYENNEGLFLTVKNGGRVVKYDSSRSNITIPTTAAQMLDWRDNDDIHLIFATINKKAGIFFYKKNI
ncbi:MAG: hypothetical protein GF311_19615 [Candidatus Lokiarchaeota archaeon]|nr:hypothetical protein [Candidatus Lokiarchaeota archaeon]